MNEEIIEEVTWKRILEPGYRLITLGASIGGYQVFQILLDIKKLGMEWFDIREPTWPWYFLGFIFVGQNYLLRKAHNIPQDWKLPHFTRAMCVGAAIGWGFHTVLWLLIGR